MRSIHVKVICLFCLFLAAAFAQSDRGTITGTVVDQGGAVVPNAKVLAVNGDTAARFPAVTTNTGNYAIPSLPAGTYTLTVDTPGFKRFVQKGILVAVAQTERVDVTLEVGSTSESVTITAEAPLLKTEDAEQSHTLT